MTPELYKALRQTKSAIETQIKEDVANRRTPQDTVNALVNTQDIDTVKWFFAETVKAASWDGRYSQKTKEWAAYLYIPVLYNENGREYGTIDAHPAHINQIIERLITA